MKGRTLRTLYEGVCLAGQRLGLHEVRVTNRDGIVMYHSVRDPDRIREPTSDITVAELRRHLAYFDREFEIVDLAALREPAPDRKRVALTFDDGYRDFYTHVRPVLHEFDAPATAFVITGFLDNANPREQVMNTGHLFDTLTGEQVRDLADDPLVTVGNHTRTHHDLGSHGRREIIESEVLGAKEDLEARFGIETDRFCYPNGGYNETSVDVVGSTHAFATMDESMRPLLDDEHAALLPRVDGGLSLERIQWRLADLNGALVRWAGHADEASRLSPPPSPRPFP
jgi:peptidoglycan/xylan/chitin deacetylase (PgdA/CDA1 family)